jgi:hypothetical protein
MRFSVPSLTSCGAAAIAVLLLAGCGSDTGDAVGAAKSNNILKGSVSDDMIAYDSLKSEPPPAKVEPKDGEGATAAGSAPTNDPASPRQAAEPAPVPTPETAEPAPPAD